MVTDLTASTGPTSGDITLQWTAPRYTGSSLPMTYQIRASSSANINTTGDFNAAQALSAFSTATIPAPAAAGSTQSMVVTGLNPCTVYYFAIRGADSNATPALGAWLRSVPQNFNVNNFAATDCPVIRPPVAPVGLDIQITTATARLSWLPVTYFWDGVAFADPNAPVAEELSAYHVYRATAPTRAAWNWMGQVSTGTWSWTDLSSGSKYYYKVRAQNSSAFSADSMIRAQQTQNIWVVGYDGLSTLEIPVAWTVALSSYNIATSSMTGNVKGRVLKSINFDAKKYGIQAAPDMELGGLGNLLLRFDKSGSGVVASGLAPEAAALPENLSVFWYNGGKWLQLYGRLDSANQLMYVQTKYLGQFQLRSAERVGAFVFNAAGVSNRTITPNGDGKNDTVVFTFDNPQFSEVTGKIFDLKGAFVGGMSSDPSLDPSTTLIWDGRAGGRVVPGGVYIYQISAEGRTFTGTVVVIK